MIGCVGLTSINILLALDTLDESKFE